MLMYYVSAWLDLSYKKTKELLSKSHLWTVDAPVDMDQWTFYE